MIHRNLKRDLAGLSLLAILAVLSVGEWVLR